MLEQTEVEMVRVQEQTHEAVQHIGKVLWKALSPCPSYIAVIEE